ncbi:MAG: Hpt domain-containing protein [Betaproteobacteria bacterium]
MATDSASDFDLGPLSWVQGEIDQALTRGLASLATFRADPRDVAALKHARTHIHQAAGAIQMVGMDAVAAFTDEIERQLAAIEEPGAADPRAVCDAVDRACRKLAIYLGELVNGAVPIPLKLFPEYEAMQRVRGVRAAAPTDLFYPDLSPRAPKLSTPQVIPPNRLPSYMVKQRRLYQRGMLGWLRGNDDGAKTMRDAIAGIEDATTQPNLRAFWWTVGALFDALTEHGLESGFGVKQLAARVDLQIRRVVEGSAKVADRLRREVLYYVAISAPAAPSVLAVQRGFKLGGLIPSAEVLNADLVRIQPHLREARELLTGAKDAWLKVTSGRAENLPKLKQTLTAVHKHAAEIGNGALMKLTAALVGRLDKMPASGSVSEPLAMEYATGMLLAESAVENYANLGGDFPKQVEAMLARLDAAQMSRPMPAATTAGLDEMSKRAQERLLLAQVGREIQANLRHMEQVLDAFFRDNAKRAELASLTKDTQQIRGALTILGLDDADRLLGLCQQQIETYADPETPVSNDDLELLAESLSGLGFYIEAVEQQRPERDRLIAPLLAKRLGEAPAPAADAGDTVEAAVAELRAALPALVEEVRRAPSDAPAREGLRAKLAGLKDDADLIGDTGLAAQAAAALAEFDAGGTAALAATVTAIAETAAPAPAISEETQRLLATDATGLDAELLDIYLTEADEVLDSIADQHRHLALNHGDRESLRTSRRGFHTLKGSGRMVGLSELGEIAFQVEKVHNRLLEEDRPVTPAVVTMIDVAEKSFRQWVEALSRARRVTADPGALHAAIVRVEAELPHRESVLLAAPAAAVAPAVAVVAPTAPALATVQPMFAELPELGSPVSAGAPHVVPLLDVPDFGGGETGETIEITPVSASPEAGPPAADADDDRGAEPEAIVEPEEPDELTIGDVTVSTALWKILIEEADLHLATLAHELSVLQFDPHQRPSPAMVRASHTLCGIHRTGGFPLVAATAKALEQCLLALQQRDAPVPGAAHPVLARAVDGLGVLVGRVKSRAAFTPGDTIEAGETQQELELLRQDSTEEVAPADAEAQAAREAAADEREEPPATEPAAPAVTAVEPTPTVAEPLPVEIAQEPIAPSAPTSSPAPAAMPIASPTATTEAARVAEPEPHPVVAPVAASVAASAAPPLAASKPEPEPAPQPAVDPLADIRDDVDPTVLPIFVDEAAELYPRAGEQLRAWRRAPHDDRSASELRRTLHTLKGSARMAGAMRLGELTHLMESRLMAGDAPAKGTPALFDALDADLDHIAFVLDALRGGRTDVPLPWVAEAHAAALAAAAEAGIELPAELVEEVVLEERAAELAAVPVLPAAAAPIVVPLATAAPAPALAPRAEAAEVEAGARAMLRVRADTIDRLVNEAGEVAIARARVEGELRALKSNLLELTSSVIRLRTQVREIEIQGESQIQSRMSQAGGEAEGFDPLEFDRYTRFQELTRSLAEGVNDVSTVQQSLLKNLDDADAALVAQARMSREVQQQLFSIRTVSFGSLSERLYRILRALARELGKRANLEIRGAQTELDRSVLEKLVGPLEHLLRNALDHGIETTDERTRAGKSETGEVTLTVRQVGNEIAIEIADDGAGIDLDQVRAKAVAQGRIAADAQPTPAQLIEHIFHPGFTTAVRVTQVSGRGIGMDVVRSEIAGLGGRVEVATTPGKGTTFVLWLPLTLAVAQAVLVRAGGRLWALPAPMVEQVQQIKAEALVHLYVNREVQWQGRQYPFHYLPRLLGDMGHNPESGRYNPVLLLRSGQSRAAIHVDEMIGNQEVVVKNIGPQLARVSGIAGATVLGNGEIVLIINPVALAQRAEVPTYDPNAEERVAPHVPGFAAAAAARAGPPTVMIVDDSLTVRKITSRLLTRAGFRVTTAKDGIDALQLLVDQTPDVILLDIEMPRMDGFEFTKTIKGDPKSAHIPIIMITSRTAEKHRNRAQELGVDLYLGKPFQEEELLRHLREMLALPA